MDATPTTEQDSTPRLWKVLGPDGASCHGGTLTWPLPAEGQPGAWVSVAGPIVLCERGLHLTSDPVAWMVPDGQVYVAEGDGASATDGGDKIAYERVRLLRLATVDELAACQIYRDGEHQVCAGKAWASDSATVQAWGRATIRAWGRATVEASDSATVRASDSATIRAWGRATVEAWDSATVQASDSATVEASDSATVEASDSATVEAWDSATVQARDSATVISTPYHSPSAEVALSQLAAHVDRRGGGLVLRRAEEPTP